MMAVNVKDISKFLYWTIMPMAIGFIMFSYLDKMEGTLLYKAIIFLAIAIPLATIRVFIGVWLFKEKPTLAEKIMRCDLRRKHGNGYCAVCPDSYECATDKM
jgi:drug/metabolite transporter (DMT)-like permease